MKIKRPVFLVIAYFFLSFLHAQNTLKLDAVFSNQMVFQRNQEIPIWGMAKPNSNIRVTFKNQSKTTTANNNGYWKINLNASKAGGPYQVDVVSGNETIKITDVLVGDVWLASGQSNMHLDLKRTLNGKEVAKKANNSNIRIYNMKPTYPTGKDGVHTLNELEKIQNNQYFNTKGWVNVTPENVLYFSAVAYYFAEKLQKELDIPIGIIHNAVPGSPIESWLSKKVIDSDVAFKNFIKQRWVDKEDEKDAMITTAKKQISLSKNKRQKHPWMPSYSYENGILPIKQTPIKGVIWYQGESNAEHPKLYKKMFKTMVALWRQDFKNAFPFYYVQLTSRENRPAWSEFRNAQRELLDIVPNTKMAVITDVGDRQDTHAKNKQPVGERLALLALGDTYKITNNYESPLFDKISIKKDTCFIHFKGHFNSLKQTSKEIIGFEISNDNSTFERLIPKILKRTVVFKLPKHYKKPMYVRYAWKPYTEANLVSNLGLPVSTFKVEIK